MNTFNPILVVDVFRFVVLTNFWYQRSKVKVTAGSEKRGEYNIFVSI